VAGTRRRRLFADGKRGCLNPVAKEMEAEATEMAAELLLPGAAARRAALAGMSDAEVAQEFDVSVELARWRMNATGARRIAQREAEKRRRNGSVR
jgi:Zn-dependent peptidase ImmA (M78 family)